MRPFPPRRTSADGRIRQEDIGVAAVIDRNTGSIRIAGYRQRIRHKMTLDEFLASPLAAAAHADRSRRRHKRFHFRDVCLNRTMFHLSVLFTDGVISCVNLCCSDNRYGKSWEDWSEQKERARKAFHDRWLRENLGPKPLSTAYSWGRVTSCYDARSGGSSITIRYIPVN